MTLLFKLPFELHAQIFSEILQDIPVSFIFHAPIQTAEWRDEMERLGVSDFGRVASSSLPSTVSISLPSPSHLVPVNYLLVSHSFTTILTALLHEHLSRLHGRLSKCLSGVSPYRYISPNLTPEFLHHILNGRLVFACYPQNLIPTITSLPTPVKSAVRSVYFSKTSMIQVSPHDVSNMIGVASTTAPYGSRLRAHNPNILSAINSELLWLPEDLWLELERMQQAAGFVHVPSRAGGLRGLQAYETALAESQRGAKPSIGRTLETHFPNLRRMSVGTYKDGGYASLTSDAVWSAWGLLAKYYLGEMEVRYSYSSNTRSGRKKERNLGNSCAEWRRVTDRDGIMWYYEDMVFYKLKHNDHHWVAKKMGGAELDRRGRFKSNWDPKGMAEREENEEVEVWKLRPAGMIQFLFKGRSDLDWQRYPYECPCEDCGTPRKPIVEGKESSSKSKGFGFGFFRRR